MRVSSAVVGLGALGLTLGMSCPWCPAGEPPGSVTATRVYENRLTTVKDPKPILADFPKYVEPITETARFEAPVLVDDPGADLDVRAWRFSYNARGIVEV